MDTAVRDPAAYASSFTDPAAVHSTSVQANAAFPCRFFMLPSLIFPFVCVRTRPLKHTVGPASCALSPFRPHILQKTFLRYIK